MKKLLLLIPLYLLFFSAQGQLVDLGFESWEVQDGYNDPTGWQTGNAISHSITGQSAVERSSDSRTGQYSLRMKVVDHPASQINGMVWTEVPVTDAPTELIGHYKFDAPGASVWTAEVVVMDADGNPLGIGQRAFRELTDDWKSFRIPIKYLVEGEPARVSIQFCACLLDAPELSAKNSDLLVDDLSLSGPGIPEIDYSGISFSTFPNPTKSNMLLMMEQQPEKDIVLEWYNLNGDKLRMESIAREEITDAGNLLRVGDLPRGMVILRISDASGHLIGNKRVLLN